MEDLAIAAVFGVTGWMLRTWLTHRERMKEPSMAKLGLGASEQRLARVEHAVEAIAIEVERIGEGQRHVTALLDAPAEPARLAAAAAPRAAATPRSPRDPPPACSPPCVECLPVRAVDALSHRPDGRYVRATDPRRVAHAVPRASTHARSAPVTMSTNPRMDREMDRAPRSSGEGA